MLHVVEIWTVGRKRDVHSDSAKSSENERGCQKYGVGKEKVAGGLLCFFV